MSGTSPTAAWVDMFGIHALTFPEVRAKLEAQFRLIYGQDIETDESTQDGQLISVFALAISDCNAACIAVYNEFSPSTAQGVGLSSMVKINGLQRSLPSHSSVALSIIGVAGTLIENGQAMDASSQRWNLPPAVIIPPGGEVIVTGTADVPGAIGALPNTIVRIATVTLGWQLVNNPVAATPGAPVESDVALRQRQTTSTALPSQSILSGIVGAVLALDGVTACVPYENDTNVTNPVTTLPPHSIALVVRGGDSVAICETILRHKTPGCFTYGVIRETVMDLYQLPHDIGYFIPAQVAIGVAITLTPKANYTNRVGQMIMAAVADYINGLGSGEDVLYSKLWLPANLCDAQGTPVGQVAAATYDITAMTVGVKPGPYAAANVKIEIYEVAVCDPNDVVLTVT